MSNTISAASTTATSAPEALPPATDKAATSGAGKMSSQESAAFNQVVVGSGTNTVVGPAPEKSPAATTHSSETLPVAAADSKSAAGVPDAAVKPVMSEVDVNAHVRELMSGKSPEKLSDKREEIERKIGDPSTPPELKAALSQVHSALFDHKNPPALNNSQMEAVSTLQRHRDVFPIDQKDLQKKIDDPKTPPDLKAALIKLRDDPALALTLDTAREGGAPNGIIGIKDLNTVSERGEMKAFTTLKTREYTELYIPSDANPVPNGGRKMTANDAMREMYLYSDSLPKDFGPDELRKIADGSANSKKMPPQLMAAAQYMLDNPTAFKKLTENGEGVASPDGRVTRSAFLDNISRDVYLTPGQTTTLKSLDKNRDVFFASNMTRDSLKKLLENPESSDEVKKTAKALLNDPQLYGMLDNAKTGHHSSSTKTADDGVIAKHDLDALLKMSTTYGKQQPDLPPITKPTTPGQVAAMQDMKAGVVDDPEEKKKKGGELNDMLKKVFSPLLKIGAGIMHGIAIAVSFLGTIPIFKPFLAPVVMAAEGLAAGMDIARAGVEGKDMKQAAAMAAIGIAGAAVSAATVGGAGAVVAAGVKAGVSKGIAVGVGKAAGEGIEAGVAQGAKAGLTKGAGEAVEGTAKLTASKSVTEGADTGVDQAGKAVAKAETKDQAKKQAAQEARDDAKNDARDIVTDQVLAGNQNGQQRTVVQPVYQPASAGILPATDYNLVTKTSSPTDTRRQQRLDREAQNRAEEESRQAQTATAMPNIETVVPVTATATV